MSSLSIPVPTTKHPPHRIHQCTVLWQKCLTLISFVGALLFLYELKQLQCLPWIKNVWIDLFVGTFVAPARWLHTSHSRSLSIQQPSWQLTSSSTWKIPPLPFFHQHGGDRPSSNAYMMGCTAYLLISSVSTMHVITSSALWNSIDDTTMLGGNLCTPHSAIVCFQHGWHI